MRDRDGGPLALATGWSVPDGDAFHLAAGDPSAALERVRLDSPDDTGLLLVSERVLRARALLDLTDPHGAEAVLLISLTDRELSVLQYLPPMMTYPEIADELHVSVNTAKSHLRHLYAKVEVANRRQAVTRARELGPLPI